MKRFAIVFLALFTAIVPLFTSLSLVNAAPSFNDPNFQLIWQRNDLPVTTNPNAGRSWTWSPDTIPNSPSTEPYNGGTRVVQYFDKGRMEVNNPNGDRSSLFFVTSGLLVKELVTGQEQTGDNSFTPFPQGSATIPVAGDPNDSTNNFGNVNAPTYASFKNVTTFNNDHFVNASPDGTVINASIAKDGTVGTVTPPTNVKVVASAYDNVTHHNMVDVFLNFMNQQGQVYNINTQQYTNGPVFYNLPLFVFGHPVSEPFWVTTNVAGKSTAVLVQLFERRVLTFTPSNQPAFQVEMGNIGQHYYKWRYVVNAGGGTPTPTPTPTPNNDYTSFRAAYNKANGTIPTGNTTSIDFNSASAIHSSVALDSSANLAVFGTDTRGVFAVDTTTGSTKWRFAPSSVTTPNFSGTPTLFNGVVYIGANDGKVYAINEADGTQKWATPASGQAVTGVPATDGTNLYFASRSGVVYSYDLATGQNAQWQFNAGAEIDGGPIIGPDGTLYFGTNGSSGASNAFYAVKNGTQVWKVSANASDGFLAQAALTSDGNVLYVGTVKGLVYAFNKDGTTKWTQSVVAGTAIGTTPAIASQGIFVGADNGTEYLLDPNNGTVSTTWKVTLPSAAHIRSSAAVVDNVVYFGADNGKVYGFDATNSATEKFQASTTAAVSYNAPVVSNGALYITSTDGHFYVFK